MAMSEIKCMFALSTTHSSPLTARLERHSSTMDTSYRESHLAWRSSLSDLHDAVDAALAGDAGETAERLAGGQRQLTSSNHGLTALGQALVELRSDLFDRGEVDPDEPLLAREPFFATLDYDAIHRELAGQGAVLPGRIFWDETVARLREGGARGACRLLDRHVRELQSDLHTFIADVEAASHLPLRPMAEALHDTAVAVGRVTTGFTRLVTICTYVSILCDRASRAHAITRDRAGEAAAS